MKTSENLQSETLLDEGFIAMFQYLEKLIKE